ncbi:hypothetical protein CATMIT_01557, partial [Catenibacterium mitsuokai DSM 15897]
HRPGGGGDLRVPAPAVGDGDPVGGGAAVAGRHLRGHGLRRHVAGQPVADGAGGGHRLRGRRCDRDDREHRALHRARRAAVPGRAQGRAPDRLHHHLADRVVDRGADPAVVHGRRGRAAVPRIRDHPGHHHRDFGGSVADPHADAGGALDQAAGPRRARPARRFHRPHHRALRRGPGLGAGAAGCDLAGGGGDAGADGRAVHRHSQGL